MSRKTLVVIPTFQEAQNIESIIEKTFAHNANVDILVVDDSSPDGTAELIKNLQAANKNLHLLSNPVKAGLGKAYVAGFNWGLARDYLYFVEMDADGSHNPAQLPAILEKLNDFDISLGSRWIKGGKIENWPLSRQILSKGGNLYTRLMLGISIKDATGGYRAYRREVLEAIDLANIESQGYCFQVDMVRQSLQTEFKIAETPITFTERELGTSKMSRTIAIEAVVRIGAWGVNRLLNIK